MLSTAVIPAAGLGLRVRPFTKHTPKALLPIRQAPALSYLLHEVADTDIKHIILIINPKDKAQFTNALQLLPIARRFTFDLVPQVSPDGLGEALWCAQPKIKAESFALLLPDELYFEQTGLTQLISHFDPHQGHLVALRSIPLHLISQYGNACLDEPHPSGVGPYRLSGCVEKPDVAQSQWALVGRYLFTPDIWKSLTRNPHKDRICLTEAINTQCPTTRGVILDGLRFDIGRLEGYISCCIACS